MLKKDQILGIYEMEIIEYQLNNRITIRTKNTNIKKLVNDLSIFIRLLNLSISELIKN